MKKALLIAAVVLSFTTGCDDDDLHSGTVYDKKFTAEHSITTQHCVSYNKGVCTVYVPQTTHYDDKWELCIKDGSKKNCFDVSKDTYAEYDKGDHYPH